MTWRPGFALLLAAACYTGGCNRHEAGQTAPVSQAEPAAPIADDGPSEPSATQPVPALKVASAPSMVERVGQPSYLPLRGVDPAMDQAIQQARSGMKDFAANVKAPKPGQTYFAVKKPYAGEHLWLAQVSFDGKAFAGVIANDPVHTKNIKRGDHATVRLADASDWMIIENGKLRGGATLLAIRGRLSPDERARFDQSLTFRVE